MRHRLYYHLIWTTLDRQPLIDTRCGHFLCRFLRVVAFDERSRLVAVGMVATHVHVLIATHPTTNLPKLIQRLKGGSAHTANQEGYAQAKAPLRWAAGYNLQTVSVSLLERTREYLRNQPSHHPTERIAGWSGYEEITEWRSSPSGLAMPSNGFSR